MIVRGRWPLVAAGLALGACRDAPSPAARDTASAPAPVAAPPVVLVDSAVPPAAVGDPRWQFQQSASADRNGDGAAERVALIANVELVRGRPAWDDGQRWQLYVEAADGTRTRVYARFVQLGHVEAFVGPAAANGRRTIVIVERTPQRMAVYEAAYAGPNDVTVRELAAPEIDPAVALTGTPR